MPQFDLSFDYDYNYDYDYDYDLFRFDYYNFFQIIFCNGLLW